MIKKIKIKKDAYYKIHILNLIYNHPTSRIRIGEITGIRLGTITKVVRELISEGLVRETGKLRARGGLGRKENILGIVPEGKFFIGCELRPGEIQTLILNFKGEIVHTVSRRISLKEESNKILKDINNLIHSLIKDTGVPSGKIYGVGFVDPGVIDVERGISISSTIMPSWKNVPVRKYLEEKLKLKVFLINTSQAKVLAEHIFGKGRGVDDLVFIEYGEGISCGIMSDGKPVGGYMEIAGEMGHFNFPGREEKCRCGNRGCIESIASIPAIERKVKRQGWGGSCNIENIIYAFEKGDPFVVKVLTDVSDILSITVANVIKLLNPELVIFDSNFRKMGDRFVNGLFRNIKKNLIYGETVRFEISDMGKEQAALGGAALTLKNFLNAP